MVKEIKKALSIASSFFEDEETDDNEALYLEVSPANTNFWLGLDETPVVETHHYMQHVTG